MQKPNKKEGGKFKDVEVVGKAICGQTVIPND